MATKNINPDAIESGWDEKEKQPVKQTNKFDEKNYLNVRLDTARGELTKEIKIRVLPIDCDTNNPFQKIHMHYVKVDKKISQNGFKNYICLKETSGIDSERFGNKCPFCEAKEDAWKHFNESTEKAEKDKWVHVAHENTPNEYAIIRCIERGHEEDGPKFYKFGVRSDEKDPMNLIRKIYKTRKNESIEEQYGEDFLKKSREEQEAQFAKDGFEPVNILDIYHGKDLKLTINAVRNKQGDLTDKVTVDIQDYGSLKPLSQNEADIEKWVNDTKKWNDVFAVKPYEYLEIIRDGGIPYYSKDEKKWVPSEKKSETSNTPSDEELETNVKISSTISAAKQVDDDSNGDLPF